MIEFLRRNKEDVIVSFLSTLLINLYVIYFLLRYGEPLYFHYDEVIWVKLVEFCGGEFAFYEQKWGLIVPALCLIYPLKLFIPLYHTSILRIPIIFLNCFILLKLLKAIFKNRSASFFVYFFHLSNIFSIIRLLGGKLDETSVASNIYGNTIRIFNPSFLQMFFLLFSLYFVNLLNKRENFWISKRSKERETRNIKILGGITFGLLFYTTVYWWLYSVVSVFIVLVFSILKKEKVKDILEVIILGVGIGLPAILFNQVQLNFIQESLKRSMILISWKRELPAIPDEYIVLLVLSLVSFFLFGNFSLKHIFVISSVVGGFMLFFFEYVFAIKTQMLTHITVQFKLFSKMAIGFMVKKLSSRFRYVERAILIFMPLIFIFNWFLFFYILSKFSPNKRFFELLDWMKENIQKKSVLVVEDVHGILPIYDVFPTASELISSLATNCYVFHNNINYFSDLSDEAVFERFLLRAKLLGYSEEEFANYVLDISGRQRVVWSEKPSLWISRAYFGVPKGFDIMNYVDISSALKDLLPMMLRLYSDKNYIESLMKKYRIDFIVRTKPKGENELHLTEVHRVADFIVFEIKR